MSKYYSGIIGLDCKTRKKYGQLGRNRYKQLYGRWFVPLLITLCILGLIIVSGLR